MPAEGPVIVAANHLSNLDPVVVGCLFRRNITFLAKAELFRIPVLKTVIKVLGAVPLHRGRSDIAAMRTAMEVLREGRVLCLFPEGTRSRTGELLPLKQGVAMLAWKSGAPVLPVALWGTNRWGLTRVKAKVGKPLYFEEYRRNWQGSKDELYRQMTAELEKVLRELLAEIKGEKQS